MTYVYINRYTYLMGSRSLKSSPFERAVIDALKDQIRLTGLTVDRLAERAGITRARCYKIFAGDATCTITDFWAMCDALNLRCSAVTAEAERRISSSSASAARRSFPHSLATVTMVPGYSGDIDVDDLPASYAALDLDIDPALEAEQMSETP